MNKAEIEPTLRTILASLPDGVAHTTRRIVGLIAAELKIDPDDFRSMMAIVGRVDGLARAFPGLCSYGDPEPGTGGMAGKTVRRKIWRRVPNVGNIPPAAKLSLAARVEKIETALRNRGFEL